MTNFEKRLKETCLGSHTVVGLSRLLELKAGNNDVKVQFIMLVPPCQLDNSTSLNSRDTRTLFA